MKPKTIRMGIKGKTKVLIKGESQENWPKLTSNIGKVIAWADKLIKKPSVKKEKRDFEGHLSLNLG